MKCPVCGNTKERVCLSQSEHARYPIQFVERRSRSDNDRSLSLWACGKCGIVTASGGSIGEDKKDGS